MEVNEMIIKRKQRLVIGIILMIAIISISIIIHFINRTPYRYCENCLQSNIEYFDALPTYIRNYSLSGTVKISDENTPKEINEILDSLNKQYQKDSDYPVFTAIEVYSDNNGNLAISIQAKKEIIKSGNGIDTPDVRCYSLVYVEPNYVGSIHAKDKAPFYDNWRTWSSDTYSG